MTGGTQEVLRSMHVTASVGPKSYGLGSLALNLARAQREQGWDSQIWCLDTPEDAAWAAGTVGLPVEALRHFPRSGPSFLHRSGDMERAIALDAESPFDVVHQHGIWAGISRATNVWRRKYSLPTVVGPMGTLEPWALHRSRWKKKIALALYEAENLRDADCLHACAPDEYRSFREFGLKRPVAIIPNGVADDVLQNQGDALNFRTKFGIAEGERLALFLARISPVKGLPLLIDALKQVESAFAGWRLVIAGADEFGHLAEVRAKIQDRGLDRSVLFTGPLFKKDKWDAFAAAEFFVLPSTRDAGPLVIPEALGSGLPVLTTKGTPWKDLETFECGWWTDVDVDAVADALRRALFAPPEALKAMGQRGRELVARKYTWSRVAELTIELYDWLRGNGARPQFVEEN